MELKFIVPMSFEKQLEKCEVCEWFQSNDDEWCYMFPEIIIQCAQFRHNKELQTDASRS